MTAQPTNKFNAYNEAKSRAEALLEEITQEDVVSYIREYLKENNLFGVAWLQYTPSFNDGEPCTFRCGEFYQFDKEGLLEFAKENNLDPSLLETDDLDDEKSFFRSCSRKSLAWGGAPGATGSGRGYLDIDSDILLQAFGDGYAIVVTQSGVYTQEHYD